MFTRSSDGLNQCAWFFGRYFHRGWGLLMMAGILLAVVVLVYLLSKNTKKKNTSKDALEQLKSRYVNGDIDEEEFRQKKKVLEM